MAHTFKHGDFVRVDAAARRGLGRPRRVLRDGRRWRSAAIAVGYLAWWACRFTYESWQFNELAQGLLPIPIWIPQSSFALGALLLLRRRASTSWSLVLRGAQAELRRRPSRSATPQGDFSSDV